MLAKHNTETLGAHFDFFKSWLDAFFIPDCEVSCEDCPFHEVMKDDGNPVKIAGLRAGDDEHYTLCTALETMRRMLKKDQGN